MTRDPHGFDKRITDLAAIAAAAAGRNANCPPQLLMADIAFAIADAVADGRIILGQICKAPGCDNATGQDICDECDEWVDAQVAKIGGAS